MDDWPSLLIGVVVAVYWCCVGAMIVRVSRRTRSVRDTLVPTERRERVMWAIWVPMIACWIALPFVARAQSPTEHPWIGLPRIAQEVPALVAARFVVALLGVACLVLSIRCWRHMGRHWRAGVDHSGSQKLFTDGPFSKVRHPIYGLSFALMICTVLAVPTAALLVVGCVHFILLGIKTRNEEAHMLSLHGALYREYQQRTRRFVPWRRLNQ